MKNSLPFELLLLLIHSSLVASQIRFVKKHVDSEWTQPSKVLERFVALSPSSNIKKKTHHSTIAAYPSFMAVDTKFKTTNKPHRELSLSCGHACLFWCSCENHSCDWGQAFKLPDSPSFWDYLVFWLPKCTGKEEEEEEEEELQCQTTDQELIGANKCPKCMNSGQQTTEGYYYRTCIPKEKEGECASATPRCFGSGSSGNQDICDTFTQNNGNIYGDCEITTNGRRKLLGDDPAHTSCTPQASSPVQVVSSHKTLESTLETKNRIQPTTSALGFVRIPKTGSTTALSFLRFAYGMYSWEKHVKDDELLEEDNAGPCGGGHNVAGCVFAPANPHDIGGNVSTFWNRCPHIRFGNMVTQWASTLDSLPSPVEEAAAEQIIDFHAFTFLRDPFDRLVSYFYYLRKFVSIDQFLNQTVTESQYEAVRENNFGHFVELLHTEGGGKGLELPYQYKYIHEDPQVARDMLEDNHHPARVLGLVTECYEASLHLLTQSFDGFYPGAVEQFMKTDLHTMNSNRAADPDKPNADVLQSVRSKAQLYFADDFLVYNAAVDHFLAELALMDDKDEVLYSNCMVSLGRAPMEHPVELVEQ